MIPKITLKFSSHYPSADQDARCQDIIKSLEEFDIVTLNEAFGGIYSEIKENIIQYATKAGFFYIV